MQEIDFLRRRLTALHMHEEYKRDLLMELSSIDSKYKQLKTELDRKDSELKAIRKMHEREPIMPFYDTLPSARVSIPDNIYELRLAVQGEVEHDPGRPVVAMSVREYGHPKNFATQVWVDKFSLLMTTDRKKLIEHTLHDMYEQMIDLFDKEEEVD